MLNIFDRGDQIFFSATCPGQVANKNSLVLRNFLLIPKYFSNHNSMGQVAIFFFFVVVALLFYVHGKHLRSCRDGQLT